MVRICGDVGFPAALFRFVLNPIGLKELVYRGVPDSFK